MELGFGEFREGGGKSAECLSFANRILRESLNSMFDGISFDGGCPELTEAIVGIKKPTGVENVRVKNPFGLFNHTVWNNGIKSVFNGDPYWIYVEDTVISDFIKPPSHASSFPQLASLGWSKGQIKEAHGVYTNGVKKLDLHYILLLNVSETIKFREKGRAYSEALMQIDQDTIDIIKLWLSGKQSEESNQTVKWAQSFMSSIEWLAENGHGPIVSGEFPYKRNGQPFLYEYGGLYDGKWPVLGGLSEEDETYRLFCVNGQVAVLPIIDWINWDTRQSEEDWRRADERICDLANSGFTHLDDAKIPWHDPENYSHPFSEDGSCRSVLSDYKWLAREGHPLYHLSVGMLVRHGIYEDPDSWSPQQRFDLARKGGVLVPKWMDKVLPKEK